MGRLDGKVAIVTGAAPRGQGVGNGKAMAMLFAREGAKVLLVNRSAERAEELRREIAGEGGEASVFAADVTQADQVAAMAEAVQERYGRLDVLANNVGVGAAPGRVEEVSDEDWHNLLHVNMTSAMLCSRAAVPLMRESGGGGSIINVSSIAGALGLISSEGAAAYAATKSGVHGLTLSIAADYATEGIRCNCIIIGSVNTPMVARLGEEARERRRQMVPMQTEGTGWDIGWAAVYLASDEARWVTGVFLPVDGGLCALRTWPR
ncbi:MAG: SDR family NAD(P)-dependent oxidoreductase [Alphaproteobacteria bacterium]|jgi:NAD(P)-dependent dehydrogenase (short-subunit alcohol dehydrogenase family)|nr:SDR family NAD(P)-dependent oxidoreductase [Alphaproteobacteria bacterium]MDP6564525.1 SDR family NAD(P)-dependent oxidoreductase [Alphaproteobacteria bacterium]MDP6811661.1 SDR family NAD(P)-dependent oxidoreductase [Alphaproteobacteria bacterium]